jgi:hypothetical protein
LATQNEKQDQNITSLRSNNGRQRPQAESAGYKVSARRLVFDGTQEETNYRQNHEH